jgi:F0F1-type ATP synthase delta subunit
VESKLAKIKLPINVASKQDVTSIHRELTVYIDQITQSTIRDNADAALPPVSEGLKSLAAENKIDLRSEKDCAILHALLEEVKQLAPSVHISFSVEPSPEILQKIVAWFREKIDPQIIIQVGLQPTIAAGIVLRTPNKQFDFSLRSQLYKNRSKLIEALQK